MKGFFTAEIQEKLNKIMSECEIEMPSDAIAYCIDQVYGRLDKFDWCHDCKEYDQEKHCCHRWSKVIRDTLAHIEPVKTCTVENVHPVGKYTFGDCECGAPVIMPDKFCSECGLKLEWK